MKTLRLIAAAAAVALLIARPVAQRMSVVPTLENYDVRLSKDAASVQYLRRVTPPPSTPTAELARARTAGLSRLRADVSDTLQVIDSPELGTPEVIGVASGARFLTQPSADRVTAMRAFMSSYADAYGLSPDDVQRLELVASYQNPAGNMSWVELEQRLNGLPVFRGRIRGGFTAAGELVRTTGALATGLDAAQLATMPAISASTAVSTAAANVGWSVPVAALVEKERAGGKVTLARATMADDAKAWLLYFPLASGSARLAWAAEIWGDRDAFLTVVDAGDGTVLFRKNLTARQTTTATYAIYKDDSPAPMSPSTIVPASGTQAPFIARTPVTLIGNEPPFTFNNLGWMTDGTNLTDGNNVQAGIDRDGIDGVDASVQGTGRVFDFTFSAQFDNPLNVSYQRGEVTDTFYWTNWYHDQLYLLGFTEAAGNFQHDNFGRGGLGGDRISAESQDSSSEANADFTTPPDGSRPRMQMYIFPGPHRGSGFDHDVLLHELTHGTSNRLHSNSWGLTSRMAAGMGEGWSDVYARALLSTADEDPNGVYTTGAWITYLIVDDLPQGGPFLSNYYYGIRRFPYAVMTTVGPNGKPHNPLTFADIDRAQALIGGTSAFPLSPIGGGPVFEAHNAGEVWAMTLLEVRARFITRLGHAIGNQRFLQFVTDGMKLDPANPTFLQGRDAILAAANAGGGTAADRADIWAGFAARGMGFSARVLDPTTGSVVEAFDMPGVVAAGSSIVAEQIPNGRIDPGEQVTVSLCLATAGDVASAAVTGTLQATGGVASPSGAQSYGAIAPGSTVCRNFTFTAGPSSTCGSFISAALQVQEGGATPRTFQYLFDVGGLTPFFSQNFDGVVAPALPPGWTTAALSGLANPWTTTTTSPDTAPNRAFAVNAETLSDSVLISPAIALPGGVTRLTFRQAMNVESTYDGGVLEISIAGAPFADIIAAGGAFVIGGYNGTFEWGSQLGLRPGWVINTAGYTTTSVNLPISAAGKSVVLRWRLASDGSVGGVGWAVDTITLSSFECSNVFPSVVAHPESQEVPFGQGTTLSVVAAGTSPLSYQWYQGDSPSTASPVIGATSSSFTTPVLTASTRYWVRVSNAFGIANSSTAVLSVTPLAHASYDGTRRVPTCALVASSCDSDELLNGRGNILGGAEPHQPNTINSACGDGNNGAYHQEESIDRIKVSTLDATPLSPGNTVRIDATAFVWNLGVDRVDFYFTSDAASPSWSFLTTLTPGANGLQTLSTTYVLPAGSLQAVRVVLRAGGAAAPCVPGNFNDHDDLVFAAGVAAGVEMLRNGTFSGGLANWSLFEIPDIVHNSAANGAMKFHKADPTTTSSGQAVVFQQTNLAVAQDTALAAQFDLGNGDTVRKRISVLVLDGDFRDLSVCTFWVPPGAPARTYGMKAHTTKPWTNASIYFYVASPGLGDYLLDNVSLKIDAAGSVTQVGCVDPAAPGPSGGADGPNLLVNGDFSSGLAPWGAFFDITHQISSGVFEFIRPGTPGAAAGGILQSTGQAMTAGQILTAGFQLGNSSSVRKRVSVLLHDLDFSDLSACTFWLAPGQPLSPYSMRMFTTKAWTNATISFYAATSGLESWSRLDNVTLQRTPSAAAIGTECVEPVPGPIAPMGASASTWTRARVDPSSAIGVADSSARPQWSSSGARWRVEAWSTGRAILGWAGEIDLTAASTARMTFESWLMGRASTGLVQARENGGNWHTMATVSASDQWTTVTVDLTPFVGRRIEVRLVFDGVAPDRGVTADTWLIEHLSIGIDGHSPTTSRKDHP